MVEQASWSRKRDQIKPALIWKFTKPEVDHALERIERLKSLIQCALTEDVFTLFQAIHGDIVALGNQMERLHIRTERLQSHTDQDLQHRLAQWLGIPDPSTNYHAALQKRHPKTGLWLVNGIHFAGWKSSESSLMWLYGNAGCGKTVLSAAALQSIIQHRDSRPDTAVGYFYFDFNDAEKLWSGKAIRSILFQFAQQANHDLQNLKQMYQSCGNEQQQPAEDAIRSLLRDTTDRIGSKFVVLDALDECTDREDLLTFLRNLVDLKLTGLRVMATSRREKGIEERLTPMANYSIDIQSAVVDADIQTRFRWVYCQLESIRHCAKLRALQEALSSLPKTLDETYDRILQGLESRGQLRDAVTTLRWWCYSIRPLHMAEIVEVLAIEGGDDGGFFPEERLPDPADIMVVCSSLISCSAAADDDDDNYNEYGNDDDNDDRDGGDSSHPEGHIKQIRLAHFSVKEYLSNRCALHSDFQTPALVLRYPLVRYAAEHWWRHAQKVDEADARTMIDLASRLLSVEDGALLSWIRLYNLDALRRGLYLSLTSADVAPPLYYAASVGLLRVTENVLLHTTNVNAQGGRYGNALQAASYWGYEKVVQLLLDAGAEHDEWSG
ncbi:uncharacterized protein Z518_06941 [Rhinocladiella mackenziei CBS 650.93]|uniref:NACHT domain-containing protein n=1 Tax=Rhinocladiella mackenziei CBS 650.93 TaxID=1442369 RepID=A0A0D2IC49_9EURO|nr:uncharacterized protein Z518_06941 [Rhinocladiella mackenziei CBS 650.93]KIX03389.1 hypothetical protein Z518_06941 [Rhinocladiella mackenziei CBS 650.93]